MPQLASTIFSRKDLVVIFSGILEWVSSAAEGRVLDLSIAPSGAVVVGDSSRQMQFWSALPPIELGEEIYGQYFAKRGGVRLG